MERKKASGKKTLALVTHHRPHIDDICGMWLLARFWRPRSTPTFRFVSSSERDPGDNTEVWVGVGRGQFDEHKGDIGESATTLVYHFLLAEHVIFSPLQKAALDGLVRWVRDEDVGLHDAVENRALSIAAMLRSHFDLHRHDSTALVSFGFTLLDDIFAAMVNSEALVVDWQNRVEFDGAWGRAVAVESAAYGVDDFAYQQGFSLLVLLNPARGFRAYRAAARSTVDLTETYETVKRVEPKADWYLHHSRKLLICGSDVAPDSHLSKLSLQDLIRAVQPFGEGKK
jgi:hypothetical protein